MGKAGAIGAMGLSAALSIGIFLSMRTERLEGRTLPAEDGHLIVDLEKTPEWAGIGAWGEAPLAFPGAVRTSKSGEVAILMLRVPEAAALVPEGESATVTHREVRIPGTSWALGGTRLEARGRTHPLGRPMRSFFGCLALVAVAPVLLWFVVWFLTALLVPARACEKPAAAV